VFKLEKRRISLGIVALVATIFCFLLGPPGEIVISIPIDIPAGPVHYEIPPFLPVLSPDMMLAMLGIIIVLGAIAVLVFLVFLFAIKRRKDAPPGQRCYP